MRILIVHNTLNDSRSISGALRHFLFMATEWTLSGHPTDFLCAKAGFPQIGQLAPHSQLICSDSLFDATKYLAQTWRYFPAYGYRMLTPHFTRLPHRYDLVIASTQLIVEVYPALIIAQRQGAKLAAKVHHVLAAQEKRHASAIDRLFLWSERQTMRWLSHHADLVVCGTKFVEDDYHKLEAKLGLRPTPTAPIGYGVDIAAIPYSIDFPKQYDLVHLGRLHEHKGVFDMPKMWHQVVKARPESRLLVIGEGPHRPRTEQMFRELGLENTVTFTGGVDEKTKNDLLCASRIGLSLSFEEGWGLSINEFLAAGLPVVAYGLPIFDVVFPSQLTNVPVGDHAAVAREVLALLANPARQRELAATGRKFVERYDFHNVAREEFAALERIFQSSARRNKPN